MEGSDLRSERNGPTAEPLSPSTNHNTRGFGSPEQVASSGFQGFHRSAHKVRRIPHYYLSRSFRILLEIYVEQ